MGFHVVALSNGKDKEALAKNLGAHHYFDANEPSKVIEAVQKLG